MPGRQDGQRVGVGNIDTKYRSPRLWKGGRWYPSLTSARTSLSQDLLTMLPPTEASTSDWLGEKPAPHSCREKRLGTWVCFTSESKKGSRESSGCGGKRREGFSHRGQLLAYTRGDCKDGMFLGKDRLEVLGLGGEG